MFEFIPGFLPGYFEQLTDLQRSTYRVRMYGRYLDIPREIGWVGDEAYTYSQITHAPAPWTHSTLLQIKQVVELRVGCVFNSCLISYYRNERDSVSWHSDDEEALGSEPTIASISYGATRRFKVREKEKSWYSLGALPPRDRTQWDYKVADGDLLIMSGRSQQLYEHCVPKVSYPVGPRLNLSFRYMKPLG